MASWPSAHRVCAPSSRQSSSWWTVPRISTIMAAKGKCSTQRAWNPSHFPPVTAMRPRMCHPHLRQPGPPCWVGARWSPSCSGRHHLAWPGFHSRTEIRTQACLVPRSILSPTNHLTLSTVQSASLATKASWASSQRIDRVRKKYRYTLSSKKAIHTATVAWPLDEFSEVLDAQHAGL